MGEMKNTFIQGGMNKDVDERFIPTGFYRDALNIEVSTTGESDMGAAKNSMGNTLVCDLSAIAGRPLVNARTIGAVKDEANNLIYFIVASDSFDGVYEYNDITGETLRVLQSNKADADTPSRLNFDRRHLMTGFDLIVGTYGEKFLYFTDDFNEPRRINVLRSKSYFIDDPRMDLDLKVIRQPPLYAPYIELFTDTQDPQATNMDERFLYFAYRYKYIDDQYSALSPFSPVAFFPKEYELDYGEGNNKSMTNEFNAVKVEFETGNQFVKEIQLVVRDTRSINVKIVDSFNKEKDGIDDNDSFQFIFKNSKIYTALSDAQVNRLFDNVPLKAKAQTVIGNRIAYGNYLQYRNIENSNGDALKIDYWVDTLYDEVEEDTPARTWRSDRDIELGIMYMDNDGRLTTVLTSKENNVYIPPSRSDDSNHLVMNIKSEAPHWATHYRIVVKQSKGDYYNIFPILYYNDGVYKYILIQKADRDKIKEGDYIIFKATNDGVSNSNKKYKVLEMEVKGSGFLGGSQLAGLYLKILDDAGLIPNGLITYSSTGIGVGESNGAFCTNKGPAPSLINEIDFMDSVYYGELDESRIQYVSGILGARISIRPNENGTFRITAVLYGSEDVINEYADASSGFLIIGGQGSVFVTPNPLIVSVDINATYVTGEKWIFNSNKSYGAAHQEGVNAPSAIFPGANWSQTSPETDREIFPGAVITIQITETYNPTFQPLLVFPPSNRLYRDIREWFYETRAWEIFRYYNRDGIDETSGRLYFLRGKNWNLTYADGSVVDAQDGPNNQIDGGGVVNSETVKYPVRMYLTGQSSSLGSDSVIDLNCQYTQLTVSFTIQQAENVAQCETVPSDVDTDVYHELSRTYPIEDNQHIVLWNYSDYLFAPGGLTLLSNFDRNRPHYFKVGEEIEVNDGGAFVNGTFTILEIPDRYNIIIDFAFPGSGPVTPGKIKYPGSAEKDQDGPYTPATIIINGNNNDNCDFNAWCWGNGIESYRIKDDFNEVTHKQSIRASIVIEDYKQIRNEAAITYSGIYKEDSSINRLNEFNLSLSNFKYIDRELGSIQKLEARDNDLLVFQEDKISIVLYGKNLLYDAVGGGDTVSIPEVLGTQVPLPYEYGISSNPESFAKWAEDIYCTDARRGVVLKITGQSIDVISNYAMSSYFRDLFIEDMDTQKIGAYNPHDNMYIMSSNNRPIVACELELSKYSKTVSRFAQGNVEMFTILSSLDWSIQMVDMGFGLSWINAPLPISSGSGNEIIYADFAQNFTNFNRKAKFVVSYCDGKEEEFIVTQTKTGKLTLVTVISANPNS